MFNYLGTLGLQITIVTLFGKADEADQNSFPKKTLYLQQQDEFTRKREPNGIPLFRVDALSRM